MADVDLIVIGAGMAGMNAAARASQAEATVAVVERDRVGGTCPIRGCIPSKALIRSAEVAHEVRSAAGYGVRVDGFEVDVGGGDRARPGDRRQGSRRGAVLESLPGVRLVMGRRASRSRAS